MFPTRVEFSAPVRHRRLNVLLHLSSPANEQRKTGEIVHREAERRKALLRAILLLPWLFSCFVVVLMVGRNSLQLLGFQSCVESVWERTV